MYIYMYIPALVQLRLLYMCSDLDSAACIDQRLHLSALTRCSRHIVGHTEGMMIESLVLLLQSTDNTRTPCDIYIYMFTIDMYSGTGAELSKSCTLQL